MIRADRVADELAARELDALLVLASANLRWLTGFTGTTGAAIVTSERRLFFTDFRYVDQAARQVPHFDLVRSAQSLLPSVIKELEGRVGFEDDWVDVRTYRSLCAQAGPGVELVPGGGIVERLRQVKDADELEAMRAAAAIGDRVYAELAETGPQGRTEREIATWLEIRMQELGADGRSFPAIVASGVNGARPHAVARTEAVERNSLMVVDIGCVVDGYCSDATRTFATGDLGGREREVYELVAAAQSAALEAIRAGAASQAVDAVARDMIAAAGYGDEFGHGLGHGVGLEVHEAPRLARSASGLLLAGTTVTVEPGVYIAGSFGVRIEDLVVVDQDGATPLTTFTKALVSLR